MIGMGIGGYAMAAEFGQAGISIPLGAHSEKEHVLQQMGIAAARFRFILDAQIDGQGHARERQVVFFLQQHLQAIIQDKVGGARRFGSGGRRSVGP